MVRWARARWSLHLRGERAKLCQGRPEFAASLQALVLATIWLARSLLELRASIRLAPHLAIVRELLILAPLLALFDELLALFRQLALILAVLNDVFEALAWRARPRGGHWRGHRARALRRAELARRLGHALVVVGDTVLAADGDVLLRALLVLGTTR